MQERDGWGWGAGDVEEGFRGRGAGGKGIYLLTSCTCLHRLACDLGTCM